MSKDNPDSASDQRARCSFTVIWAKVTGFPPWPARFCSEPEEEELMKKTRLSAPKSGYRGAVFLGYRLEKAWIVESSAEEFTTLTAIEKFQAKKFITDRDYRAAIVEAVRLAIAKGEIFPQDFIDNIKNQSDVIWDREDVCTVCKGTELSGKSLLCDHCDERETHFHCLRKPLVIEPKGQWYCDFCCDELGYPPGMIHPTMDELAVGQINEIQEDAPDNLASTKKRKRSSINKPAKSSITNPTEKRARSQSDGGPGSQPTTKNQSALTSTNAKSKLLNKQTGNEIFSQDQILISALSSAMWSQDPACGDDDAVSPPKIEDETCFVCHEKGNVIICDFPGCPRVYHQVCIFTSLPSPTMLPDHHIDVSDMDGDQWYCPRHFCVQCCAIDTPGMSYAPASDIIQEHMNSTTANKTSQQNTDVNLSTSQGLNQAVKATFLGTSNIDSSHLPRYLLGFKEYIEPKCLKGCSTCPFAVCCSCEKDIISASIVSSGNSSSVDASNIRASLFKSKRGNASKSLECLNCTSSAPQLQLAKILEKAWLRLSSSRLSIPFLRPLLPTPVDINKPPMITSESSDPKVADLVSILEKIRCLSYSSVAPFFADIQNLREGLVNKLNLHLNLQYDEETNKFLNLNDRIDSTLNRQSESLSNPISIADAILSGFDTQFESCRGYLQKDRGILVDSYAKKIKEVNRNNGDSQPSQSSELATIMQSFWRRECHLSIPAKVMSHSSVGILAHQKSYMLRNTSVSSKSFSITARELEAWSRHINAGALPEANRGIASRDPWSIWNPESVKLSSSGMKYSRLADGSLNTFFDLAREEAEAHTAACAMLGFSGNKRETVTLLEDSDLDVSPWNKFATTVKHSRNSDKIDDDIDALGAQDLVEDETGVILNRLQDLTTKTLHLQMKLRRSHEKSLQRINVGDTSVPVTFGDSQIIRKLHQANNDLQWQLTQRNRALSSHKAAIEDLIAKLAASKEEIQELQQQRDLLVYKLEQKEKESSPSPSTTASATSIAPVIDSENKRERKKSSRYTE